MKLVKLSDNAKLPTYGDEGAAGLDLYASEDIFIYREEVAMIPTGIAIELPYRCVGKIEGRSSLAMNYGLHVLGGVIDESYRGEIKVLCIHHSDRPLAIKAGDRIAQMLIYPINKVEPHWVDSLSDTDRGDGGFGSTGT